MASVLAAAALSAASAYTLDPKLVLLRPAGTGASAFVRLQNREARPAAVEITIHEHRKDLDGKPLTGATADEHFLVYPAQVVLLPGDEVAVQLRWMGEPALQREQAFTLVACEVPIPRAEPLPEPAEGVRLDITLLVNYEARIYVRPADARPRVVVESVQETAGASGELVEVVLANEGSAQQPLDNLSLLLAPVDAEGRARMQQAVPVPALDHSATRAPLLAGERLRLRLPRPAQLPAGRVHVQLAP